MALKFTKATDSKEKLTLSSMLVYAEWQQSYAPAGQQAFFEIGTLFVGQGAPVEVKGKSSKGKSLGKVTGKIRGNKFIGAFAIPPDVKTGELVYFDVQLPKNGLSAKSNSVAVVPPILVTDMHWSAQEVHRGDVLTLNAKIENVPGSAAVKTIVYEFDADGAHDKIAEIAATVENKKVALEWAFDYPDNTEEIPTQSDLQRYGRKYASPKYFFTVKIDNQEFGRRQESGFVVFCDSIEITLRDRKGQVGANEQYTVELPDGTTQQGQLDQNGYAKLESLPPGKCVIKFHHAKGVMLEK